MSGNLARAVDRLHWEGFLDDRRAAFLRRVAVRRLVSVRIEIRLLLYFGVLLTVSGVGFVVKQQIRDIGPAAIGLGITLAAGLCFVYVFLKSPLLPGAKRRHPRWPSTTSFSWGCSSSAPTCATSNRNSPSSALPGPGTS